MARAGLWSAFAFAVNLIWEIAHVRLYTLWAAADGLNVAWALFHCTGGDIVIALALFALAGMMLWLDRCIFRSVRWRTNPVEWQDIY